MRVLMCIAIMLLAYCMTTEAGWWRRRRRSGSIRYNNGNNQVTADVSNKNGQLVGSGTWTHKGDNWDSTVTGSIDKDGNYNVGASGSWRFKRSDGLVEPSLYNVSLQADPCNFITYDIDRNGEVIPEEFHAIFGESEMAPDLFVNLDIDGTGALVEEEFYQQAPKFIKACADLVADDEE